MVHLYAPTTYGKQDKKLRDSNIYNFNNERYHKVKCISKEFGYMNNRGYMKMMVYPKVHLPKEASLRSSSVES
jgi:hypothetical protein